MLPAADLAYLASRQIAFEVVAEGEQTGLILCGRPLGTHLSAETADVLILLPRGYPDVAPDMFFTDPWLRIRQGNQYPRQADQPLAFAGRRWQRWSRHNKDWRPGVDGLWTMIQRVEKALREAA